MSVDQQIKLVEVIGGFAPALCWPTLVLILLIYLGSSVKKFLENAGEFTFKAASNSRSPGERIKIAGPGAVKRGSKGALASRQSSKRVKMGEPKAEMRTNEL